MGVEGEDASTCLEAMQHGFVALGCSCRKRRGDWMAKFSAKCSFGGWQLFDSCFLASFLFTLQMTTFGFSSSVDNQ